MFQTIKHMLTLHKCHDDAIVWADFQGVSHSAHVLQFRSEKAKKSLGDKYLLHPSNRVQKRGK